MIGASCADIRLEAEADVAGTTEEFPYYTNRMPSYYSGLIQQVDDKEFEELLGTPIPSGKMDRRPDRQRRHLSDVLC